MVASSEVDVARIGKRCGEHVSQRSLRHAEYPRELALESICLIPHELDTEYDVVPRASRKNPRPANGQRLGFGARRFP